MEALKAKFVSSESKEVVVDFTKDIRNTSEGNPYVVLDNDKYHVALFEVKSRTNNWRKVFIKFNARVSLKQAGITFCMPIREIAEDGSLIAGQKSRINGKRGVITDYDKANGLSYERLAIPDNDYREIISMVSTGVAS